MPAAVQRSSYERQIENAYESDFEEDTSVESPSPDESYDEDELLARAEELDQVQRRGSGGSPQVDSEELNQLVTDQQIQELKSLKTQIQASEIPASLKGEHLTKVDRLLAQVSNGGLEDSSEIDNLKSEWESVLNDHPSFARRLVNYLKKQDSAELVNTTEEQVKEVMKKHHLTEEKLRKMELPGDQTSLNRLMGFFRDVNPDLAKTLDEDPDKGFGGKALKKLQGMINVVYPQGADLNLVLKVVDQMKKNPWDVANIKSKLTGNLHHWAADYNNRYYDMKKFVDSLYPLTNGGTFGSDGTIENYLSIGRNDVDKGPRNKGNEIRRFLSALFEASNKSPYLFRHYLKQLPENALLAMKDLLDYRGGGGCDAGTQEMGDRWNTEQCSHILGGIANGGELPAELQNEMAREISQINFEEIEE